MTRILGSCSRFTFRKSFVASRVPIFAKRFLFIAAGVLALAALVLLHQSHSATMRGAIRAGEARGRFAPGTHLILDEAGRAGALAQHQFATREKFREHTLELEEQDSARLQPTGRPHVLPAWCSVGTVFGGTGITLRTFADVYFTGQSRWDHFAAMEAHYLREKWTDAGKRLDSRLQLL